MAYIISRIHFTDLLWISPASGIILAKQLQPLALFLFWIPLILLVYSYIIYPWLLSLLSIRKSPNKIIYHDHAEFPVVTFVMAVHNEQDVLKKKINSITGSDFSSEKIRILVGSDASTDDTDSVLHELASVNSSLRYVIFKKRMGKSAIINELVRRSGEGILIITDANVILQENAIFHILKHFKNNEIGLVDSNMKHKEIKSDGISFQESAYISREVRIKYNEGLIWGTMMGPFGGCYAIRKELYPDIPSLFLVDDFFINMKVILSGHKTIIEPEAVVYEDVSNSLSEEFRRKVRIATGNFQNLIYFSGSFFKGIPGLAISFISHKILRWLGPFFMFSVFLSSLWLSSENIYFRYVSVIQIFILILPLIDYLLGKIKIHVIILRFITHFVSMNFALLVGFIKFLKGVESNAWKPTRRNQ